MDRGYDDECPSAPSSVHNTTSGIEALPHIQNQLLIELLKKNINATVSQGSNSQSQTRPISPFKSSLPMMTEACTEDERKYDILKLSRDIEVFSRKLGNISQDLKQSASGMKMSGEKIRAFMRRLEQVKHTLSTCEADENFLETLDKLKVFIKYAMSQKENAFSLNEEYLTRIAALKADRYVVVEYIKRELNDLYILKHGLIKSSVELEFPVGLLQKNCENYLDTHKIVLTDQESNIEFVSLVSEKLTSVTQCLLKVQRKVIEYKHYSLSCQKKLENNAKLKECQIEELLKMKTERELLLRENQRLKDENSQLNANLLDDYRSLRDENESLLKKNIKFSHDFSELNEIYREELQKLKAENDNLTKDNKRTVEQIKKLEEEVFRLMAEVETTKAREQATPPTSVTRKHRRVLVDVVIAFTGLSKDPKQQSELAEIVQSLNGRVHIGADFTSDITHVVCPPGYQSVRTMAAALSSKWIVSTNWLIESKQAGKLLPEATFGHLHLSGPATLRSRSFRLTDLFTKQQASHQMNFSCCKTLIEPIGKGRVTTSAEEEADWVLCADSEEKEGKNWLRLKDFIKMIPGHDIA